MAKRTAIIDIGSNSARMVVYEKTSRFGFHLIKEIKSRVRVGEGAYEKGGILQDLPMKRTYESLKNFVQISQNLSCRKILCVATSALRDAPNASTLTNKVKKNLNLNVKIIDGKKEAYFGGVACINLLGHIKEATSIDIGGGSTELAKIQNGKITDTISLNIGTVRLKELFFDHKKPYDAVMEFINNIIKQIPQNFKSDTLIAIGGTLRALSNCIMESKHYPLKTVHGFAYEFNEYDEFINTIANSSVLKLKSFPFKKDRYDTIREGCSIFYHICKLFNTKQVITCGAGVREGVYLSDLLRSNFHIFPQNFNPSIRSLQDRFIKKISDNNYVMRKSLELFDVFLPVHNILNEYKYELSIAAKLYNIGQALSFYQYHIHGYHFILNNLNFGFTHNQKILIAILVKYHSKKLPNENDLKEFNVLLPSTHVVNWLSFLLSFAKCLNADLSETKCSFKYEKNTLHVSSDMDMGLAKEAVRKLVKPASFAIIFD